MVLTKFFRIEPRGVHQAALLLAFTSIANGVLGLFRDRLLAGTFGATENLDVYYAAFRIPDFVFSLSLFFVASTAFIPLFIEHASRSREEAQRFFDAVFTVFLVSVIAISALAYIIMPAAIPLLVPGFSPSIQAKTIALARIMLLSPVLLGASGLVSSVIQSSKKFFTYALTPIVYNSGIIFGILVLEPLFGLSGLAYGVAVGALLHLLIQLPTLIQLKAFPRFRFAHDTHPFRVMYYSFPRATALSVNQLTVIVLTGLASTLGAGAIAIFNLSNNLYALPIAVIGLSYSVASFPTMSELALSESKDLFFEHLLTATRHILFWTMPITGLTIVLRAHIVRLILGTGAFAWVDTHVTIASLLIFSFAIVTQSLVTLFVRAYHALGRVREPIIYNALSACVTMAFAYSIVHFTHGSKAFQIFMAQLFHVQLENLSPIVFLSLPLAFSIGSFVNAVLLGTTVFRLNGRRELLELFRSIRRIFLVTVCLSFAAYAVLKLEGPYFGLSTTFGVFIQGSVAGIIGLVVWFLLARAIRLREYNELYMALKTRFSRASVLQPDVEHL